MKILAILAISVSCHAQIATNFVMGKPVPVLFLTAFASNSIPVIVEITEENVWALKRLIARQISPTNGISEVTNFVSRMFTSQLWTITQNEHHLFQQEETKALLGAHPEIRRRIRDLLFLTNVPPPLPQ